MEKTSIELPIISWIGKTSKLVQIYIQQVLVEENIDLTSKQLLLLKLLHAQDGQMQNDLAIITSRDKGSLVRLIHNMEKKNLVVRKKDRQDKRINRIYLTSYGKKVFADTIPTLNRIIRNILEGISNHEKQQLISILSRVQSNIKENHFSLNKIMR